MITTASVWREAREQGVEVLFPSGNSAVLRPVDVAFFVRVGRIPSVFTALINDLIEGKVGVTNHLPDEAKMHPQEWIEFLNQLVAAAFVHPRIVDVPLGEEREVGIPQGEDEISIDDVAYSDKIFVYGLFTRPAHMLKRFREIQIQSLQRVQAPAGNGAARVEPVGDSTVGGNPDGLAGHLDEPSV